MCFGKCSEGVEHVEEVVRKKKRRARVYAEEEGERTSTRAKRRVVARTHRTHTRLSHNSHSDPTPPQRKTLIGQAHPPQKAGMRTETTVFGHETGGKRVFFLFAFCTPRSRDRSHPPSVLRAEAFFTFFFLYALLCSLPMNDFPGLAPLRDHTR